MAKFIKTAQENFKQLFALKFFKIALLLSLIFLALTAALPAWQLLPEIREKVSIPLHYNTHFGIDSFGMWWNVFMVSVFGGSILLINYIAAIVLWTKEKVLSYFLASVALLVQVLLFISIIFVVLFNLAYG